mmetsp:Transcript_29872/g.72727  ORF Transcript_29872/g.72727 Transcript_29872/m.72727 type:complete len:108 (+) Transcript_29872:1419-1742(+)
MRMVLSPYPKCCVHTWGAWKKSFQSEEIAMLRIAAAAAINAVFVTVFEHFCLPYTEQISNGLQLKGGATGSTSQRTTRACSTLRAHEYHATVCIRNADRSPRLLAST